jgi:hypothetical protein
MEFISEFSEQETEKIKNEFTRLRGEVVFELLHVVIVSIFFCCGFEIIVDGGHHFYDG